MGFPRQQRDPLRRVTISEAQERGWQLDDVLIIAPSRAMRSRETHAAA